MHCAPARTIALRPCFACAGGRRVVSADSRALFFVVARSAVLFDGRAAGVPAPDRFDCVLLRMLSRCCPPYVARQPLFVSLLFALPTLLPAGLGLLTCHSCRMLQPTSGTFLRGMKPQQRSIARPVAVDQAYVDIVRCQWTYALVSTLGDSQAGSIYFGY